MGFQLDIVTPERELFTGEVDSVLAPGVEGQLGVLPRHVPLITVLEDGLLVARREDTELTFAIHGGYMQVLGDRVIVLADVAEWAADIDIERAEAARRRAVELLKKQPPPETRAAVEQALGRSLVRLRVARRRRGYRPDQAQEPASES
jgi:F-type H+-transporting ATPase subunit epsilon